MAKTTTGVTATIKNGVLTITLPAFSPPRLSASGKSYLVGSTNGNVVTDLEVEVPGGRGNVVLGVNAYVKKDAA